jgi:hypothetical protein
VRVRREHVAAETNLLDLILRRQPAAAEAVDAQNGAGPGHVLQCLLHLVGVVRQLVDLRLSENRGKGVASRIRSALARVASDVDRLGELRDRQLDFAPVVAWPNAHVARVRRARIRETPRGRCNDRVRAD